MSSIKINYGVDQMNEFKFAARNAEIEEVITAVKKNSITLLHHRNKSGLTHFLKKVMQLLWDDDTVCYYINGESHMTIAQQIIGQTMLYSKDDSPERNKASHLLRKRDKGDLAYAIVTTCLYALDAIPLLPNIGSIANNLITSIKESIDTDQAHINDFKTEKAISCFCEKLQKQNKKLILLIDNLNHLNSGEYSFLFLMLERFHIHILLPFDMEITSEIEFISKYSQSIGSEAVYRIKTKFDRPNNKMIQDLYVCYGVKFLSERLDYYEKSDRNIHIIMADIMGLPLDIGNVDLKFHYMLKVLKIVNTAVPQSILFQVLRMENLRSSTYSDSYFQNICTEACELGLIKTELSSRNQETSYTIYQQLIISSLDSISFVEKQSIVAALIKAMDQQIESLDAALLTFAISNLEHDYSHAKKYILAYVRTLQKKRQYPLQYLNQLNYFDCADELLFVVGIYYDCGIYDKPLRLLKTHTTYSRKQSYRIAKALISERLHIDNYSEMLEQLFDTVKDREKRCLIAAVLFVAYLNSDSAKKYTCFFDQNSKYFYGAFQSCNNYPYLLRNVSYYLENVAEAIMNYEKCLAAFDSKDPVNYNRTISNYLCYLMRNDQNEIAKNRLSRFAHEAEKILDYSDPSYLYLNNNYGIFLMRYTEKDPAGYFSSIPFSAGTTETPYIYAQVNLALTYLISSPEISLRIISGIENLVQKTPVPRTKQFYAINRALIEYANEMFPIKWIDFICQNPIRGNTCFAQSLRKRYYQLNKEHVKIDHDLVRELSLPGYLFYRYFSAEMLLSYF